MVNTYEAFYTACLCGAVDLVHIDNDHAGLHALIGCRKKRRACQLACFGRVQEKEETVQARMREREGERERLCGNVRAQWRTSRRAKCAL